MAALARARRQQRLEGVAAGADLREVRAEQGESLLAVTVGEARREGEHNVLPVEVESAMPRQEEAAARST